MGSNTVCDYKAVSKVPDNYHIEYDGHYYSVVYTQCGKPAILKATHTEIRICDSYNRLLCKHKRSYRDFTRYITEDSHMRPEHLYYKEVNFKDGAYYRRWASVFGSSMYEFIDRLLKSFSQILKLDLPILVHSSYTIYMLSCDRLCPISAEDCSIPLQPIHWSNHLLSLEQHWDN